MVNNILDLMKQYYNPSDYGHIADADAFKFAEEFAEPETAKILEIGANQEPVANILSIAGYDVTGIDLMDYMQRINLPLNFKYIRGDFNDMCFNEEFDVVIALSTVEHIGLGVYGDQPYADGDTLTIQNVWRALKSHGKTYLTVPVGQYQQISGHWKVYDRPTLKVRIIQNFRVIKRRYFASGCFNHYEIGDDVTEEDAFQQVEPNATVLLILEKT